MKFLNKFLTLLFVVGLFVPQMAYSYVDKSTAVLRVLNKAAGKVQVVRVPVDYSVEFDKLTISARACKQTDPFDAENYFSFIEIYTNSDKQIYGGWMNRNEPGKNPLQNPDWDVWLVSCE